MLKNQFYNYYITKNLESLSTKEVLAISYISAKINIYPFQVASTNFVMNDYYNNLGSCSM